MKAPLKRASMLSKLRSDVNKLKRSVEVKSQVTNAPIAAIPDLSAAVPTVYNVPEFTILQGITDSTRIGNRITLQSVELAGVISSGASSVTRMYLVLDKQSNGATATAADVFDGGGPGFMNGFRNADNLGRFTILSNRLVTAAQVAEDRYFSVSTRRPLAIHYDANAGAITDLTGNHLLVMYGQYGGGAAVTATSAVRLAYTDN